MPEIQKLSARETRLEPSAQERVADELGFGVAVTTTTTGVEVEIKPVTALQASRARTDKAKRKYFAGLMICTSPLHINQSI